MPVGSILPDGSATLRVGIPYFPGQNTVLDPFAERLATLGTELSVACPGKETIEGLLSDYKREIEQDYTGAFTVELYSYEDDRKPVLFATARTISCESASRPCTVMDEMPDILTCGHSHLCALRQTTSGAVADAFKKELESEGKAAALALHGNSRITDTAPGTIISMHSDGSLVVVNDRCPVCENLMCAALLKAAHLNWSVARHATVETLLSDSQGAWLVHERSGVMRVGAIDQQPISWRSPAEHIDTAFLRAMNGFV